LIQKFVYKFKSYFMALHKWICQPEWPDWAIFWQPNSFWKLLWFFGKDEVALNMETFQWNNFPFLSIKAISKDDLLYVFLGFKRGLIVDILDFQNELWWRQFGNCFGYFFKILGNFFPIVWSHCWQHINLSVVYGVNRYLKKSWLLKFCYVPATSGFWV
jgi:hypothetical protein